MELLEGVTHLGHASIRIERDKVIYIDPFKIEGTPKDADIIFCSHDHFDHLSVSDIKRVRKEETVMVVPQKKAKKFKKFEVIGVEPLNEYEALGIKFKTVPAYNPDKKFHKKKENWVGFIIELEGAVYYFAGDTDYIPEMDDVKADVVFLPVGGTYTMNAEEAANAANSIKPKVAVPIHFGSIVGTRTDAESFIRKLEKGIQGRLLLP
ncbi:MAG: MBL fold metallo-hydrolase [bacterium]|nr:MBL fold metallo-hydrolase [bacterium]